MVSIEEDSGAACAIYGDCERVLAALGSSNSLSIDTKPRFSIFSLIFSPLKGNLFKGKIKIFFSN